LKLEMGCDYGKESIYDHDKESEKRKKRGIKLVRQKERGAKQ